jgi:hypothetical protein
MSTPINPRALTIREFCQRYKIGRTKAWMVACRDRQIVTRKVGRRVLIDFDSAEAWYNGLPSNEAA